jgi:F0F1-type ATP synthase assembly protein I
MPLDDKPNATGPASPEMAKAKKYSSQASLALELPFTIVGGVLLGGVLGYFLDHWLHTKMIFTFILGGVGFYAGLREVLRRLDGTKGR